MRYTYLRGLVASMLGAAIGSILAVSMGLLWPLGALAGGLIGFLAYNVGEVITAIPRVWRRTHGIKIKIFPHPRYWSLLGWTFLGCAALSSNLSIAIGLGYLMSGRHTMWQSFLITTWVTLGMAATGAWLLVEIFGLFGAYEHEEELMATSKMLAKYTHIFAMAYWIVYGIVWAMRDFIPKLLHEVYCDERLVTGISALGGVLIGYRHHSVLEGIIAATALWTVQYFAITAPLKRRLAIRI